MLFALVPVILVGLFGSYAGIDYLLRNKFIFTPVPTTISAEEAGISGAKTLELRTDDGEKIVAWYAAPSDANRPLILYFHGQGGIRKGHFSQLVSHGYGLLAIAYRGYHGSTGSPTEEGVMRDAEAAYAEAARLHYGPERIVVMGESLGTGVATILAARHEEAALVLDSPYDSVPRVAEARYGIPVGLGELVVKDRFHADDAIRKVKAPILMSVGCKDDSIPSERSLNLYELAGQPKKLILSSGVGHITFARPDVLDQALVWIAAPVASDNPAPCP
jgi:hypothetical protein